MVVIFRWTLRLTGGVIIAALLMAVLAYLLAARSLPDYTKTLKVDGITASVEIVRNNANVPHIFGETDADVFFGLGYAHAQDRLWQMTMLRRTVQGRLSEVFGKRTLSIDTLLRRLDIYRLASVSVASQDARTRDALSAYAAGVNIRIAEINNRSLGRGAPEMFLFGAPISPWRPADSLAVTKLMALQLSGHLQDEVLRARTSLVLPDEARLSDILPDMPGTGVTALPKYAALFDQPLPQYAEAPTQRDPLHPVPPRGLGGASNAWAAAPSRSASGGTILANDPHLGFTAPAIWYLARLELAAGGVIGGTIPGMPVVLAGRSATIGWGITSSYLDDQDLFIEQLNPNNPEEYRTPDGFKPFETRRSIINIKDAEPVTLTLRWSDNGPVLSGSDFSLSAITPKGHVAALAWTALSPRDTSLSAAMGVMQSVDVQSALISTESYIAPSLNLTLVDKDKIALKLIGAMPQRNANHQSKGRMPSPGWIEDNRWQSLFPAPTNPRFLDPEGGILGNTNNKLVQRPFPVHVSFEWGDSQRIQRWKRLMQKRQVHTRDSFIEAQLDTVSFTARTLLPLIGADLWFTGEPAPNGTPERKRQIALELLANWTGEMNEHLPEPLIYSAWLRALQGRLIQDELGPLSKEFKHVEPLFIERVFRNINGAAEWCDILQSSPKETCTDVARSSLDEAILWLEENYTIDLTSLRWGDAHQATHDHAVLGAVPVLRYFVNIRQSTSGGDNTLMRGRTKGGEGTEAFLNVHGAGYRGVYDFTDPDSSLFVISTGQSGHLFSRHYDDLGKLWRRGKYIQMSLDEGLARAAAVGITTLIPEEH